MRSFLFLLLGAALCVRAEPLSIAVGHHGRRVISRDRVSWAEVPADPATGPLLAIACDGKGFVATGGTAAEGLTLSTNDGTHWQSWRCPAEPVGTITAGHGRFVAACGGRLLSADGDREAWEEGTLLPFPGELRPRQSACGDTEAGFLYVFLGEQMTPEGAAPWRAVSGDGLHWSHSALATAPAHALAYGAGIFVTAGPGGLLETSHDGEVWARQVLAAPDDLETLVWTGTQFLAQGKHLHSSADGFAWRLEPEPPPGALLWGQPLFALSIGQTLFFREGGKWNPLRLPAGPALTAIAVRN